MPSQDALPMALDRFENCLETPIIPGELDSWVSNARHACIETVAKLKDHVPIWHEPALEGISRQDPELANRVEQLRQEDAELREQAFHLMERMDKVASDADKLESYEPVLKQEVSDIIDSGLKWVFRTRKQEVALTTWYREAFNRGRGVPD
jgi:hypothetical protein